jgi:carbon storage regulator
MLVLTRKAGERLYIGDDICVVVVRLEGGQVRIGIEAPREIVVMRAELLPGSPRRAEAAAGSNVPNRHTHPIKPVPRLAREIDIPRRARSQ